MIYGILFKSFVSVLQKKDLLTISPVILDRISIMLSELI